MKNPREAKRMSDAAVKESTGKTWPQWFKILDKAGAKKMRHQDISAYLAKAHKVGPWWCQMIAVPDEHARALREQFQKCDGDFAASGSRTLSVPRSKSYDAWTDKKLRQRWLPGAKIEITTATKNKSLRAKWNGGASRVSVYFYPKGAAKSQVAIDHMKLSNSKECTKLKTYWFEALNRLQEILEA
jgi:hypothetical protein